jgi:hypothetical protein
MTVVLVSGSLIVWLMRKVLAILSANVKISKIIVTASKAFRLPSEI